MIDKNPPETEAEADAFVEWLDSIIESLRNDEGAIDESTVEPEVKSLADQVAESMDEEATEDPDGEISEECPEHLKAHQFKKKDGGEETSDKPEETEESDKPEETEEKEED